MKPVVINDILFQVDFESFIKEVHLEANSPYTERLQQIVEEAMAIARPKAMYKVASVATKDNNTVTIDGIQLASRVVRVNLDGFTNTYPGVATCGQELNEWAATFTDILEKFWVDTLCEKALRAAISGIEEHLRKEFELKAISAMNPGSVIDWSIQEQRKLFEIIGNTKDLIGVELTDSCLMLPVKSVSGIWFPVEHFENCMLCSKDCPRRKAPYDPHMYHDKYRES